MSDVALATRRSRFGLPEVRAGFIPVQPMPFVVRRIGASHAGRMAVTGSLVSAEEALRMGLVHVMCEDADELETRLQGELRALHRAEPGAVADAKRMLRLMSSAEDNGRLLDEVTGLLVSSLRSSAAREGIGCFMRKEQPPWVPRGRET